MTHISDTKGIQRPPITRASERTTPSADLSVETSKGLSQESFSAFSQVITHRLGGLLSGIEGFTDLILTSLHQSEDRENAFRILESVSRMNGILEDLKHYEDSLDIQPHLVEAASVGSGLMRLISDTEANRVRYETTLDHQALVNIDEMRIRQALLSVVRNALEVTQSSLLAVTLQADLIDSGSTIRFRVQSPIPLESEAIRRQVFDPFFTTKASNLGLGLTMARRIFRAHSGDVSLTSAPDELGTEFTCTIPVALS